MKILVTYALDEECAGVTFAWHDVSVLMTGVGKVASAARLMQRLASSRQDLVVNVGTAGSVRHEVGEIVLCDRFEDRDLKATRLPGVPCVTMNPDEVYRVLEARAAEVGCPLVRVMDTDAQVMASWPDCVDMVYKGESYTVALPGRHQARNASLAIEAVAALPEFEDTVSEHVREGLETVSWPCRMQKLMAEPVIVDVTHTMNGARCLHSDISEIYGKVVLVLAMLSDKDIEGVSRELAPVAGKVYAASPDSPRAALAERVAEILSEYCHVDGVFPTVGEAMDAALEDRDDMNVLVTGSFRTAEDALKWLQSRYARS